MAEVACPLEAAERVVRRRVQAGRSLRQVLEGAACEVPPAPYTKPINSLTSNGGLATLWQTSSPGPNGNQFLTTQTAPAAPEAHLTLPNTKAGQMQTAISILCESCRAVGSTAYTAWTDCSLCQFATSL
ncbi:Hypothetical predicted protein [Pelobates cultripes]|uniref:Uncharacterized protein n=1 Tax=Pelobates cultripes TaxID=61616 RepID=A0AAD1RYZ3_PELCU|nr:Hypothetical predicted protein [Pelobates cultripes]